VSKYRLLLKRNYMKLIPLFIGRRRNPWKLAVIFVVVGIVGPMLIDFLRLSLAIMIKIRVSCL
jgi:hypothetical protein